MDNSILSSSTLIGSDIKNRQGENMGTVKDLTIDLQSGRVAYLVLAFGGFLGIGDKYFAVPLQAFSIDPQDNRLILNLRKEQLENAPGFDRDQMPEYPQKDFVDEVYSFYGYGTFLKEKVLESEESHSSNTTFSSVHSKHGVSNVAERNVKSAPEDLNTRNRDFDPDNNRFPF